LRERDFYQTEGIYEPGLDLLKIFIKRVHKIIGLAYTNLNPREFVDAEEEDITGELKRTIELLLDRKSSPDWMDWFHVSEEYRIHSPERKGKRRRRLDIRIDCSEQRPRTRMPFEAKRLDKNHGVSQYVGKDGLRCFLDGRYARDDKIAGMLGYVQNDGLDNWAVKLEKTISRNAQELSLLDTGSWRHEQQVNELSHTYKSGHDRPGVGSPIGIFHTLLLFN
jgi:hypothetical protein